MLTPVQAPEFGGIDLQADPQDAGLVRAIDLLDVDLNRPGRLRSRDGYVAQTATASSDAATAVIVYTGTDGTVRVVETSYTGASGTRTYNYSTGAVIANTAVTGVASYALFGTPAARRLYFTTGGTINRLENDTFTVPGGSQPATARFLAVTPWDNRLVAAGTDAGVYDTLEFSDEGDAETFSGNTLDLTPGDGSPINGMVAWSDKLFVFKGNKFFVFYSTTDDGAGNPIFNYEAVLNVPGTIADFAVGTGPDGVYYQGLDSHIYRTVGGRPEDVSGPINAWLEGTSATVTTSPGFTDSGVPAGASFRCSSIWSHRGYVYFAGSSPSAGSTGPTVVFDTVRGNWMIWDLKASCGFGSNVVLFGHRTTKKIMRMSPTAITDNGTAIAAKWRSGGWSPAEPGGEAVVREWLVDGWGTVNFQVAVSDASSLGSSAALTLGTAPAFAQSRDRRASRGRNFSFQVSSGNSAPWFVERVIANVRSVRGAGLRAT